MSSQLGALLVHIDFSPKTCFFGYFCLDSPLFTNLGYFPAYFPQLLLCYSLYTYFPQETKTKIAEPSIKEETSASFGQTQVKYTLLPGEIRKCGKLQNHENELESYMNDISII